MLAFDLDFEVENDGGLHYEQWTKRNNLDSLQTWPWDSGVGFRIIQERNEKMNEAEAFVLISALLISAVAAVDYYFEKSRRWGEREKW